MQDQQRHRRNLFLLLCAGCALGILLFGIATARRMKGPANGSPRNAIQPASPNPKNEPQAAADPIPAPASSAEKPVPQATVEARPTARKVLYFRSNALGPNYSKLAVAALDHLDEMQFAPDLSCDRVHFAGGKGVCLSSDRGVFTTYSAVMFDQRLHRSWSFPLNGIPSRVRISPGGRLAAITVFLSGHSYTSLQFATQTNIVDVSSGQVLADLEKFSVTRDGAPFESADFNFWGVTFMRDENRFYATLWSKGKTYLVKCDFARRHAEVVYENVECASLSPDNKRIAYKERRLEPQGAKGLLAITWRFCLLDLGTMTKTELGETRSVDDQVEWLDNDHILYAVSENEKGSSASTDIWSLPVSPGGSPQLLFQGGFSPAVVELR